MNNEISEHAQRELLRAKRALLAAKIPVKRRTI